MTARAPLGVELSDLERQARLLVETDRAQAAHNPFEQMLRSALLAMWASAVPLSQLVSVGSAIHNYRRPEAQDGLDTQLWQRAATRLVRAKVLRSRVVQGVRLYEINY